MVGTLEGRSAPGSAWIEHQGRSRRVLLLLTAVTLLGLGDLHATLLHLGSVGMAEVNPIAAYLMEAGSVPGLVLFKLGGIAVSVGLIWGVRHHLAAELGTWLLFGVMVLLTVHWYQYNAAAKDVFGGGSPHVRQVEGEDGWYTLRGPES